MLMALLGGWWPKCVVRKMRQCCKVIVNNSLIEQGSADES
jgi:hypothetical protein